VPRDDENRRGGGKAPNEYGSILQQLLGESTNDASTSEVENVGGDSIKIILTVDNPDRVFEQALKAGATEVFPVGEDYGWRLGRLSDPFGLHWEIGKPLTVE